MIRGLACISGGVPGVETGEMTMSALTTSKKKSLRNLVTITGFAAVTAAATLAVCAPRTTFADGDDADRMGEYTDDGTKFDDIVVKGEIQKDAHSKTGWLILITAKNTADHPETMSLEMDLDRRFTTPEARVAAEQAMLYSQTQSITVPANGTITLSRPVSAWAVPQLETGRRMQAARADAQRKVDNGADVDRLAPVIYAPFPSFEVAFFKGGAKPVGVQQDPGMMMGAPGPADVAPPPPADPAPVAAAPAPAPAPASAPAPAPAAPPAPGPVAAR
jgi:hypothetical protein